MSNTNLHKAKKEKNDEFYTLYEDIEKELKHYDLTGKSIYCNCDNPNKSNFYKYFKDNFHKHNLKHLYATGYNKDGQGYYGEYNGTEEILKPLNDNGDYKSEECINILKIADVIITNPPFSLFRPYIKLLMDYNKKFLVIGNQNAITYKEIFPYIKNNELWLGTQNNKTLEFEVTEKYKDLDKIYEKDNKYYCNVNACWFTNIDHINPNKPLILTKTYNPIDYPHYDNYDAINVNKVKNIPMDYDGVMGVPITFLQYYKPKQFEILGYEHNLDEKGSSIIQFEVNGKGVYKRILIKKK